MRIGLCQVDSQWEDRAATRDRVARIVDSWGGRADCLIFPEMVLSGFSMRAEATTLAAEDHACFARVATETGAVVLYGGVEDGYNCVFSVASGRAFRTEYRKQHLFTLGGENQSYRAGTERGTAVQIGSLRIALAICYDLRFAYHFWREAADCDGFIVMANWPAVRREHWLTLLRARAIENQAFVVGVNRVGDDPKLPYCGDSAVFGPFGDRWLECGAQEGVFSCEVDAGSVSTVRSNYRFIEDRQA